MKRFLKNKKGFTLFEVIIYVAILGMIVVSFISFVLAISNVRTKSYVVSEVNSNLRIAMDLISQKIRSAEAVTSPLSGVVLASLELDMPNSEPTIVFALQDGVLYLTEDIITENAITNPEINITFLKFTNLGASGKRDSLQIEMVAEYRNANSQEYNYSNSLKTTVNLRK